MCVAEWSTKGFVKDGDLKAAAALPEVNEEGKLEQGWDAIIIDKTT
jgi:hypothetical protein